MAAKKYIPDLKILIPVVLVLGFGAYQLLSPFFLRWRIPDLEAAYIAVQTEPGSVPVIGQRVVTDRSNPPKLFAVLAGTKRGESKITYFSEAKELQFADGRKISDGIETWNSGWGHAVIQWYKLQSKKGLYEAEYGGSLKYSPVFIVEWGSIWHHYADAKPLLENQVGENLGTVHLQVMAVIYAEKDTFSQILQKVKSPGVEALEDPARRDQVVAITLTTGDPWYQRVVAAKNLPVWQNEDRLFDEAISGRVLSPRLLPVSIEYIHGDYSFSGDYDDWLADRAERVGGPLRLNDDGLFVDQRGSNVKVGTNGLQPGDLLVGNTKTVYFVREDAPSGMEPDEILGRNDLFLGTTNRGLEEVDFDAFEIKDDLTIYRLKSKDM